jgi:hypothetical protein
MPLASRNIILRIFRVLDDNASQQNALVCLQTAQEWIAVEVY